VGRHGGMSDEQYASPDHEVENVSTSITRAATGLAPEAEEVMVVLEPLGGMVPGAGFPPPQSPPFGVGVRPGARWWEDQGADGSAHPWWDDAPVPPPVVVASADGRTPAITFSPDADPFSAGGVFARGARDGEPAVVVHAAPDAAVVRSSRRGRPSSPATGGLSSLNGRRAAQPAPDTGSLVRPYVAQAELGSPRRPQRPGDPLERIVEITPGTPAGTTERATEWAAPWTGEPSAARDGGRDERPGNSLFEPPARRGAEADGPWTAPREQALPSRKVLRARERAQASGSGSGAAPASSTGAERPGDVPERDPGARTAGRRIAKSGVLAVTAVGVAAASAPSAFSALALRLPSHPAASSAQAALAGFAGSGAVRAPAVSLGSPTSSTYLDAAPLLAGSQIAPADNNGAAARQAAKDVAHASAAAEARAGAVAAGAGRTLVDVGREQVLAEAARKAKIAQQVSRNAVRDPRAYARLLLEQRGWGDQYGCLDALWTKESNWNPNATNPSSGAFGIPQALPGSKMASVAADWRTNPATQVRWGLGYIASRYSTPCGAWAHSQATGWY
jgi:hypothetical protein